MTGVLPDDIADCGSDAERARWLLPKSWDHLRRDEDHIRRWLRLAQFLPGIAFLDQVMQQMRLPRRDDGTATGVMYYESARGQLERVALGLPPVGLGS